jgi:hypothetical protein
VGLAAQLGAKAPGGAAVLHALRDFVAAFEAASAGVGTDAAATSAAPSSPHLLLFLEKVGVPAAATARWLPMQLGVPLRQQLAGKWLCEYPTIHVALPAQRQLFPLADGAAPEPPPPGNRWI